MSVCSTNVCSVDLSGSEKFIDNILNLADSEPSFIMAGVGWKLLIVRMLPLYVCGNTLWKNCLFDVVEGLH